MKTALGLAGLAVAYIWYKQWKAQKDNQPVNAYIGNDGGVNYEGATVSVVSPFGQGPNVITSNLDINSIN